VCGEQTTATKRDNIIPSMLMFDGSRLTEDTLNQLQFDLFDCFSAIGAKQVVKARRNQITFCKS